MKRDAVIYRRKTYQICDVAVALKLVAGKLLRLPPRLPVLDAAAPTDDGAVKRNDS